MQHYGYEYIELDLLDGKFAIHLNGFLSRDYEKDGKKLIDYSFPYSIQFTYYNIDSSTRLSKLVISDILLVGAKSKSQHLLSTIESNDTRVYGEKRQIRVSTERLTSDKYQYESYILKAKVTVYKNEQVFDEEISVEIRTDYREEWRSDWFDEKMSI